MVPHLHIMVDCRLLHVFLNHVSQSDTKSGVHFHLALTVQKVAYRRVVSMYPLRGYSMGGEPHGLSPYISSYWQRYGTVSLSFLYYVHATKGQGSWITPAQLPSLRGASG